MSETSPRRPRIDAWGLTFLITLVVLIAAGLALSYSGVGVRLSRSRTLDVKVRAEAVQPEVALVVRAGDSAYTEPGGMLIGRITAVSVRPPLGSVDASGGPRTVDLTLTAPGRTGDGFVTLNNQVVTVGNRMWFFTDKGYFDVLVVGVDVR
jgi:hypothetical protein